MNRLFAIVVLISLISPAAIAHSELINGHSHQTQQPNFRTEKVSGTVHALFGAGGNIGVSIGPDGMLIIDTQFANFAPQIKAELKKLGTDAPRFVFNTHWHGDHTGGNEIFGPSAIILAHENVRKRMEETTMFRGEARKPSPPAALPMMTYGAGMSVWFNGEQVKALHLPNGHTDGDTILFFMNSNVVHLGDDFFAGRFPFVDLESGGTVEGLIKNIDDLIKMIPAGAKLIPGHGPISTVDDLKAYHQMMVETTKIVREGIAAGKTLEELKAAGLPEKYKEAGSGFIKTPQWIETIFKSFPKK